MSNASAVHYKAATQVAGTRAETHPKSLSRYGVALVSNPALQ